MATPKFVVSSLEDSKYNQYLCDKLAAIASEAIASRGTFLLGVSGGSVINFLADGLPKITTDWNAWRMFLCDERLVEENDPESTFGQYKAKLFPKIPDFPADNFLKANANVTPEQAADEYESALKGLWKVDSNNPSFGMADCLILGVGPDGHTCSLFPNHPLLDVTNCWVTYIKDSPKPPPNRITLTYPFINKASHILIAGKGKEKWDILENVKNGEDFPVGRVSNPGGHLEWILNVI